MEIEEQQVIAERRRQFDRIDPRPLLNRQMLADAEAAEAAKDEIEIIEDMRDHGELTPAEAERAIAEQVVIKARARERRWRCHVVWGSCEMRGTT